jgi:hypothetical protein
MKSKPIHLSEQDLILAADGELSPRRRKSVEEHLESCWTCRERMVSLQATISEFVRARKSDLDGRVPNPAGPKALLRLRLAEAAAEPRRGNPLGAFFASLSSRRLPIAGAAFAVVILAILISFEATVIASGPKPRTAFTPGEVRPITLAEVCETEKAEVIAHDIPLDKQQAVFRMYGIASPKPGQYEVDYLITPDLGGTESIRNLWPEPYSARWNARVKDRLEQRLHELVCSGKIDLPTAQHDIATDWIGAYKKYVGGGAD